MALPSTSPNNTSGVNQFYGPAPDHGGGKAGPGSHGGSMVGGRGNQYINPPSPDIIYSGDQKKVTG